MVIRERVLPNQAIVSFMVGFFMEVTILIEVPSRR